MTRRGSLVILALLAAGHAGAETVDPANSQVFVTKADCQALVHHRASADVKYKPGVDVHGNYVAPADLPGSRIPNLVPEKIQFPLNINPANYAKGTATGAKTTTTTTTTTSSSTTTTTTTSTATPGVGASATQNRYDNSSVAVAQVSFDLRSGRVTVNGQPLGDPQEAIVAEACQKAGIR